MEEIINQAYEFVRDNVHYISGGIFGLGIIGLSAVMYSIYKRPIETPITMDQELEILDNAREFIRDPKTLEECVKLKYFLKDAKITKTNLDEI